MIRSPRLWAGVAVGIAATWLLCRPRSGVRAFTGGVSYEPRPLRRQGRLLRDRQARWNLGAFGSSR